MRPVHLRWALLPVILLLATAGVALADPSALTIAPKGEISSDGQTATISGTVTCPTTYDNGTTNNVQVNVVLQQLLHHGYLPAGADDSTEMPCAGSAQPWSVPVTNFIANAAFHPGLVLANVDACDSTGYCIETTRMVSLTS